MEKSGKKEMVDTETGELVYIAIQAKSKHITGGFVMAMQEGFAQIARMGLTGEQLSVFMHMFSKMDFENYLIISQKDIAKDLNLKQPNVSRAVKKLVEKGIIHEGPKAGTNKTYRLDPQFGYKGRAKNIDTTKREIAKMAREKGLTVIDGGKDE